LAINLLVEDDEEDDEEGEGEGEGSRELRCGLARCWAITGTGAASVGADICACTWFLPGGSRSRIGRSVGLTELIVGMARLLYKQSLQAVFIVQAGLVCMQIQP
jgi:hypothetical protein